jgi:type IV pilus assembly protein PilE
MKSLKRTGGFSLIELMFVVAIIVILASIGYPSYRQYVIRGHISAAQQLMMKIASREEQYVLDKRAYTAALTGADSVNLGGTEDSYTCTAAQCANAFFTITVAVVAGPPPGYTITAASAIADYPPTMTLDHLGTKSPLDKWQR